MKKIKVVIGVIVLALFITTGVWIGVYGYVHEYAVGWVIGIIIYPIPLLVIVFYIYMKKRPVIRATNETIKESDGNISIDSDASKEEHQSLRNYLKDLERKIDKRMTRRLKGLQSAISQKPEVFSKQTSRVREIAEPDEKEIDVLGIRLLGEGIRNHITKEIDNIRKEIDNIKKGIYEELERRDQAVERIQTAANQKQKTLLDRISREEEKMLDIYNKNNREEFKELYKPISVKLKTPETARYGVIPSNKNEKPEFEEDTNGVFWIIKQKIEQENRYYLLPKFDVSTAHSSQIKKCFEAIGLPQNKLPIKSVKGVKESAICTKTEERDWILEEKGKLIAEG